MNYKNQEIVKDCLVQYKDGVWARVLFVGEEQIHVSLWRNTKEEARKEENSYGRYNQSDIDEYIIVLEYPLLGVYDNKGTEYRYGDKIVWNGEKCKVFQAIKGKVREFDTILFKSSLNDLGWTWNYANGCKTLPDHNTDEEAAIKLLTERGRIKDGKVIV